MSKVPLYAGSTADRCDRQPSTADRCDPQPTGVIEQPSSSKLFKQLRREIRGCLSGSNLRVCGPASVHYLDCIQGKRRFQASRCI